MLDKHFKRVRRENREPHIRMSILEDSHCSHKTQRVSMLCKKLNVQLAIIGGGLTGDAQLGDRVFIKRFKRVHRAKLADLATKKWREAKKRQINREGFLFRPDLLKPAPPDRNEQINLRVKSWKETYTGDIEKKTDEVCMKCHELAKETGWTPIEAFQEVEDQPELAQQLQGIRDSDKVKKQGNEPLCELLTNIKCITPKCSKKAMYNFCDNPLPMFCDNHKYEGMVQVVAGEDGKGVVTGKTGKGKRVRAPQPEAPTTGCERGEMLNKDSDGGHEQHDNTSDVEYTGKEERQKEGAGGE